VPAAALDTLTAATCAAKRVYSVMSVRSAKVPCSSLQAGWVQIAALHHGVLDDMDNLDTLTETIRG
jgi:hypothetical protein